MRDLALHPFLMPTNVGTKSPLCPSHIKAIQAYLFDRAAWRDLALFMVAIDTLLRGCDLLKLRASDMVEESGKVRERLAIQQQKSRRTVEVQLSEPTRRALAYWLTCSGKTGPDFCFTSLARNGTGERPLTTAAYRQLVKKWVAAIGLDPARYSTKTLRKSRVRPILEAAGLDYQVPQILLGHADIRSTIHYAGIAQEHALAIGAQVQVFERQSFPTLVEGKQ